ncbi:MAG: translocation/assembly module TamB domain-containing protein [Acidobacteriota bacterium]
MKSDPSPPGPTRAPREAQRLSTSRLFWIVLLFLILAAYSIWNSERFQSLFQGVSEQRLSELLQRPVHFRRVDFRMFPPSIQLADVSIDNDPRVSGEPLLTADEVTIGGGLSVTGGELRLGRVRAVRPRIALVQFPDGSWNLPPGLTGAPGKGSGLKVQVGELVVQQGVFRFEGREAGLDGRMENFTTELISLPANRYRGLLSCRKVTLDLPDAEPLIFTLDLRFHLDAGRRFTLNAFRAAGDFGELNLSGSVEDFHNPLTLLTVSSRLHVAEVERLFRIRLGFTGDADLRAELRVPPAGGFQAAGHLSSARIEAAGFPIENLEAGLVARPDALVARIEKARYEGGDATGSFRIENLTGKGRPRPMTLSVEARGISLERFFGDIHLPGTGLSGAAALSATLRWSEGGIERASGGALLSVEPGPASSIVSGRFGVTTIGGGALAIVEGRIGFDGTTFRFPASTLELTGGLRIGQWMPDFDFRLRSRDLTEMDKIFQNFVAAGGERPEPLGLGGSGEAAGHLGQSWNNPEVTAQVSAENARFSDVVFGSVRGSIDMHDGAFLFHPLRVYDGDATVSLEGAARFRRDPQRPKIDLTVTTRAYPLERFMQYLKLQYPITGRVTGSFPLSGNPPDAVSGEGLAVVEEAVLWGQRVSRITGRLVLTPGHLQFEDVRAELDGGAAGGRAALAYKDGTFEVRAAGDAVPLESLQSVHDMTPEISGRLSFELSGSGSFEKPDLTLSASLADARFFGHAIPSDASPKLSLHVVGGVVDGAVSVPGKWNVTAKGDISASPADLEVAANIQDLVSLLLFTPLAPPPGAGGALVARGRLRIPSKEGEKPSGEAQVTELRLDARDHPDLIRSEGDARVRFTGDRVTLERLHAVGNGIDLELRGALDLSGETSAVNAKLSGTADAAVLGIWMPDLGLAGKLSLDVAASGPLENPGLAGTVRIEGGRYRTSGYSFEQIEGGVRLIGSSGELEGLRAKVGEGDAFAAGTFRIDRGALRDFRFALQGRRIQVRAIRELRLTVDADLVASGGESGNELRGAITLLRGTYSKDVEVTISDLLARSRPGALAAREPWKERTSLDVRIVSAASLEVRNNLARLSGTVDLTARGTLADPMLLGQILLDEGGRVVFSDIRYEIEAGSITFSNTAHLAPFIDLRARADIKGYDLVVTLVGTWPRITASFTSNPPLTNDQILGLVLSGSPPDTRNPTEGSSQMVSAAGGILSGAVTGGFTRRTQRIFKLDRFQIDPVFEGSTLATFRTTIGKQITQELSVTSSIAVDSSKQPIIRIEWQATDTILVELVRDENGILSLTFRRRQRF